MDDFEKLGAFYLGRAWDAAAGRATDGLVMADARDFTTHAVIVGMTGSGKTGLGIGILEEAAIDRIPVIAIDPKGDLANLLLTFPDLAPADFEPWVDTTAPSAEGKDAATLAAETSDRWRRGLAEWGQGPDRIRRLREAAEFVVYTPGSTAARPIAVLRSFACPPAAVLDDRDLLRERVQTTATSVLSLLGLQADPLTSREHILVSTLLQRAWAEGRSLDVADLIAEIQSPPVQRIGVMELDQVFPPRDRFAFAMQLNNLLAAPGFEAWMEGEPLEAARLLTAPDGRPRVSVISIAHLGDAERMFFVSMLLNEVIGWMRQQPGTATLRALLYMDEMFGWLPPVANPPTKPLFLTLLKQARAYGLGLVLATQNPVDLDYKALSNAGIWCLGRLQTERDKQRVLEGLEGAAQGGRFDRARVERLLAGLGRRVFYLHSVHSDEPRLFQTRWTMSYLSGPMTREQLRRLARAATPGAGGGAAAGPGTGGGATVDVPAVGLHVPTPAAPGAESSRPPIVEPGIEQYALPVDGAADDVTWHPYLLGVADLRFSSAKHRVDRQERRLHLCLIGDGPVPVEWAEADRLDVALERVGRAPPSSGRFAPLPRDASKARAHAAWRRLYEKWLRTQGLTLWYSPSRKLVSAPGEAEAAFRARLQHAGNEARDAVVAALRQKHAARARQLQERLRRAQATLQREQAEAQAAKLDAAVSFGGAVLGALFGARRVGAGTLRGVGSAAKGAGRAAKQQGDVGRASESVEAVQRAIAEFEAQVADEVTAAEAGYDAHAEALEEVLVTPRAADVHVHALGLCWAPFRSADGRLDPAWG